MAFKLKTSKNTEEIFDRIEASENLPWYTLARIAIALSIHKGELLQEDFNSDTQGRELNRQTITGDSDIVYKCLIQFQEDRHISDDEYFPCLIKAHLDRGANLLEQEKKYSKKEFLVHLTQLDKGI